MGAHAVRAFSGRTIVHVGEWGGDTGDVQLEAQLATHWELVRAPCCTLYPVPCTLYPVPTGSLYARRSGSEGGQRRGPCGCVAVGGGRRLAASL